jgi:hypothetical protein
VKYWEIIAHKLSKAGWSWGCGRCADRTGESLDRSAFALLTEDYGIARQPSDGHSASWVKKMR